MKQGNSYDEVAAVTFVSTSSVLSFISRIHRKIGFTSRTQAVLWDTEPRAHGTTLPASGKLSPVPP